MEQLIGQHLGTPVESTGAQRYQIKSLLGKQIGRRTFLAEDSQTQTLVVIKLVLFGPDFTWDQLKLFQREAQTLRSLQHLAIPKYLDSFDVEMPLGKGFALVQTYIEAQSLQAWVSSGHTFGEGDLRAIATGLLNILTYLHQRQPPVIHRDIKPSNILLPSKGNSTAGGIYLVDFGSVQTVPSSGTMTVVGTYGYMPPEQFGGRAQPASDLYSLGATLIYLSTGQHPAELTQDNLQIAFEPPRNLSPAFAKWIQQLTYTDLSKRTASASQALHQLNNPIQTAKPIVPVAAKPRSDSNLSFQLSHKDFEINSTPSEFKVQFSSLRLKKNSVPSETSGFFVILWLCLLAFIISSSGLFWGAISIVLWLIATSNSRVQKNLKNAKFAHLRLRELSEGSFLLNLDVTSYQNGLRITTEHLSEVPVRKIVSGTFGKSMIFECEYDRRLKWKTVAIAASSEDVRWLFKSLDRWTDSIQAQEKGR